MNRSCQVQCHHAGLFSLINKVALCHTLYSHVHVDMSKGEGFIYGQENWWPELFAATVPPEGEFDVINAYPNTTITGREAGNLYGFAGPFWKELGPTWREMFHDVWLKMHVSPKIVQSALDFMAQMQWMDVVSCLIRANCHRGEQLSDRNQTLEEYAAAYRTIQKPNSILHVMAGDQETIQWFLDRFDISYVPTTKRTATRDTDHIAMPQTVEDAKQALLEVLILSMSRALIHPTSNMATAALYINPGLENVYLR